ncbi:sporulation integral membrane protein YtvI [Halobacillus locisalis]|uniref:Sporulation integral membrane protein YtvI n=1 Tax=Halobacillus locisalis TaxID=220753 RepID=A0A838CN04_9BACI|nr:sporulation integral membrane protein YtvI [Halobacillus locisalis]
MDNQLIYRFFRLCLVLLAITCTVLIMTLSWTYLYPFVIALCIAALLQPFIQLLERQMKLSRTFATLVIVLFFCLFMAAFFLLVLVEAIRGVHFLASETPAQLQRLIHHITDQLTLLATPMIHKIEGWLGTMNDTQRHSLTDSIQVLQTKASSFAAGLLQSFLETITSAIASLPMSLTALIVGILATFFFSKDWNKILGVVESLTPRTILEKGGMIPRQLRQTITGIMKAQCILICTSTLLIWVGLTILNVNHVLSITLIAALVDVIPYVGTGVIFIPWAIYSFFSGQFSMTIGLSILYAVIVITRQVLEPKLLASHFGVPPVLLLIGLFLGFQLLGVYGMILSPFVIVTIKTLYTSGLFHLAKSFILGDQK